MVAQRAQRWTCDQQVAGSNPTQGKKLHSNLWQVVQTYVKQLAQPSLTNLIELFGLALTIEAI